MWCLCVQTKNMPTGLTREEMCMCVCVCILWWTGNLLSSCPYVSSVTLAPPLQLKLKKHVWFLGHGYQTYILMRFHLHLLFSNMKRDFSKDALLGLKYCSKAPPLFKGPVVMLLQWVWGNFNRSVVEWAFMLFSLCYQIFNAVCTWIDNGKGVRLCDGEQLAG